MQQWDAWKITVVENLEFSKKKSNQILYKYIVINVLGVKIIIITFIYEYWSILYTYLSFTREVGNVNLIYIA